MYIVYLENYKTKEHISIGIFSNFTLASQAEVKASEYWNQDIEDPEFLVTISLFELDTLPNYLK